MERQCHPTLLKNPMTQYFPTMYEKNKQLFCRRCQSLVTEVAPCALCHRLCLYCTNCLQFGTVTQCQRFVHQKAEQSLPRKVRFCFQNQLSAVQQEVSDVLVNAIKNQTNQLVSAVTGAGKTEMIFAAIHYALIQGKRVCLATPRVDVSLELAPRLQNVFPKEDIALLYGKSDESYRHTQFVIATTHQLLKFKEAFDVLIVDEVDAFPFANHPYLEKQMTKVVKKKHTLIFLTATPTKAQQKNFPILTVPVRYHQKKLPEPSLYYLGDWQKMIKKKQKNSLLIQLINKVLKQKRMCLLFMPTIATMQNLFLFLQDIYKDKLRITSIYAEDPLRLDKVQQVRQKAYDLILTTTILERGVTFSNINVIIIGSEHPVFNTAALIQIAGRVGRVMPFVDGEIIFAHNGQTQAMKEACLQIKLMNQEAQEKGLIK